MNEKSKLVAIKPKFSKETVGKLEEVLKLAKDGQIKNVFIISEFFGGDDPMFVNAGEHDPMKTLGLLDWAKARWREVAILTYDDAKFDDDGPDEEA